MTFLTDFLVAIIMGYLAFTNSLAFQVENLISDLNEKFTLTKPDSNLSDEQPSSLTNIPSALQNIPKILLENSSYQQANTVGGSNSQVTTSSPIDALVNVFCTYNIPEGRRSITGTGFFIDSRGVIMTNAHVAQFLLLPNEVGDAECIIKTGTPATATYTVDLLYIPPAWILENATLISQAKPQGTGERDYALLYVNSGINDRLLPAHFPALNYDTALIATNLITKPVRATGYPAESKLEQDAQGGLLVAKSATTTVTDLMTFGSNLADVMSIGGTEVGEQGSSGGPITLADGTVIGLISTRGDDRLFGQGSLRAITLSYIDRTIQEETGFTLQQNLQGDLPLRSRLFKETLAPFLRDVLLRELR